MSWRPIDFQGIISLDPSLIDQIENYLREKETRLAHQLLDSLEVPSSDVFGKPSLPYELGIHLKLSDALEGFTRKIRALTPDQLKEQTKEKELVNQLNGVLWEFTQVLEGCTIELFQQIKLVSVDKWSYSLAEVVKGIKDTLIHYIDDLIWVIKRLEGPLSEFQKKLGKDQKIWAHWLEKKSPQLDPNLFINLNQTEQFLKMQYEAFKSRFIEYTHLSGKVESYLESMKTYPVLALMDIQDQNQYIDIFRLLKLRELNPHSKGTLAEDTVRSLKNLCSINGATKIFRIYCYGLKDSFFNSSLELKAIKGESVEGAEQRKRLLDKVKEYYKELIHLIVTIGKYREFILNTDPNPYVRSRWGFTEHPVAPEPPKAKSLLNLIYRAEELKGWYERFIETLENDPAIQDFNEKEAHQEIDKLLHEMGQPLISHSMMRNRCDRLLNGIRNVNEVGSVHTEVIPYLDEVFARAMRVDWKYHALHEFPLFHELYRIHQGLQIRLDDPAHSFRLERFEELFKQIEDWVKSGDVYSHIHEIELDINDMKTYLQDFLASIQRSAKERSMDPFLDDTVQKFQQQLLEYRYHFGKFLLNIISKGTEGQQLRNQFLFVDQYFETDENLLNDLKLSWEGKDKEREEKR